VDLKALLSKDDELALARSVALGNTRFALDLYRELRSAQGNLFFSPYSISTALALVYAGAGGNTREEMARALHFTSAADDLHTGNREISRVLKEAGKAGNVELKVANAIWPQKGFRFLRTYNSLLRKFYGVLVTPVDFAEEEAARTKINDWVQARTAGRIKDLLSPGVVDAFTRMVLVNAIYFKGQWQEQFKPSLTSEAPFWTAPEVQSPVQMMKLTHDFRYAETDALQVLELPYKGDDLSMVILLPKETFGLKQVEETLSEPALSSWLGGLQLIDVEVSLPKFELSFPFRLDEMLKSMGMKDAFSSAADFSAMTGQADLQLDAVLHKAFVSVNETGTEAAAATAVVMMTKSLSFPSVTFRADHPFLFLIREKTTGSILFMGRMVNPE